MSTHPVTITGLEEIYRTPFFDLIQRSRSIHLQNWDEDNVQLCTLLSVKTGGCSEDCSYCAQSSRYNTGVKAGKLMGCDEILPLAKQARESGTTRFCMGAAWKGVKSGDSRFNSMLETVREVS